MNCAYPGCQDAGRIYPCYQTQLCMEHGMEANRMLDAKFGWESDRTWEQACRAVKAWIATITLSRAGGS